MTFVENHGIDVKSSILQVAIVPDSAQHVVASTTPGSPLGLRLLDFAQNTCKATLRGNVDSPNDDVSTTSTGYYLALEFSSVKSNVLYAAGMGANEKSVVDVYECNI